MLVLVKISLVEIRNYALPLTNTIHNIRAFIIFDCCSCCIGSRHSSWIPYFSLLFFVRSQKMLLFRLLLRLSRFVASAHLVNVGFWFCECIFIFIFIFILFALLFRELLAFSRIATFLSISFWILFQLSEILLWTLFPLLICHYTHILPLTKWMQTKWNRPQYRHHYQHYVVNNPRFNWIDSTHIHSGSMRHHTREIPYGMPHNI